MDLDGLSRNPATPTLRILEPPVRFDLQPLTGQDDGLYYIGISDNSDKEPFAIVAGKDALLSLADLIRDGTDPDFPKKLPYPS